MRVVIPIGCTNHIKRFALRRRSGKLIQIESNLLLGEIRSPLVEVIVKSATLFDMSISDLEFKELGPLPEPELSHYGEKFRRIYKKIKDENDKLKTEVQAWRSKYEQVFNEQSQTKSLENHLREKMNSICKERDHLKAKVEALLEIVFELFGRRDDSK